MEAVIFDGKEYTKASVVAKKFGYTADYLGQLCRGKKVDARMVGRSWYINIGSLDAHRDTRYKAPPKENLGKTPQSAQIAQIDAKTPRSHYLSRIDVEPILKKKTVSLYKEKDGAYSAIPVKYEADEHSLIPKINREAVSKNVVIRQFGAEEVKVKEVEKKTHTIFKAEELPEVYLRGKLTVKGLTEASETPTAEPVSEVKIEPEIKTSRIESADKPKLLKVKLLKRKTPALVEQKGTIEAQTILPVLPTAPKHEDTRVLHPTTSLKQPLKAPKLGSMDVSVPRKTVPTGHQVGTPLSFKPESVKKKEVVPKIAIEKESWFLPIVIFVLGLCLAGLLLVVSLEITLVAGTYSLRPKLDFSLLEQVISLLKNLPK